ncbi:MAG: alpha/beta hydrolase [Acidobacteriaceae bacterium]|nr:alpha/beta hydrolase [Acidobacteriaceae bacterium]MBV9498136.1 alpha/beta hydrolase [Acidobacteriaceae bacterium]
MHPFKSSFVESNGIRMQFLEAGDGPLVVLLHGFPALGFSWRHQIAAFADAGYHVIAPDQRGYGQTDRPAPVESYTLCHLVGDVVGLVHALGERHAAVIGHDWGSAVAWNCALLRPDIFEAVALLSVPYLAGLWDGPPPTASMKQLLASGQMLYQLYFQEPGQADSELAQDPRRSMLGLFVGASGGIAQEQRWRFLYPSSQSFLDTLPRVQEVPHWLSAADLDFFVTEFTRTGFTGGLNWYRNMDRSRELLAFLAGVRIVQPSTFIAGEEDVVVAMYRRDFDLLDQTMPGLTAKTLIPGAGHWVQQERPSEVNTYLLRFLSEAWPADRREHAA